MIPILYEANETVFVSNGICRLQDCISCLTTEERHGIYEVVFDYPVDGMNFDKIQLGRVIAVTHDDTGDVQPFDLVSCSRPIDGVVTFRGVHISYRLNKIATTLRLSGRLDGVMNMLTAQNWGFVFSTDIPSSGNAVVVNSGYPVPVREYLGGMEGSILDNYGGEYEFDRFNVILHQARGEKKDFAIRYGLNMVDYSEEIDYSATFSKCTPYWVGSDGTYVSAGVVDSGVPSYNGVDNYPPLDLSEKFEDKPTVNQLKNAALSYMAANKTYLPEQNIKVDFIRLQDTEEYKDFASLLSCKLCDTISVIFPWYKVRADFKIVKTTWDVLTNRYESMELGDLQTSLAEALGITSGGEQKGVELVTETHEIIEDGTKTISTYYGSSLALAKNGYMAKGIVGHDITGTNRKWMNLASCYLGEISEGTATVHFFLGNTGSSTSWAGAFTVDVLWQKI